MSSFFCRFRLPVAWVRGTWWAAILSITAVLSGCASSARREPTEQQQRAYAMWQERCKKAGVFIHKTVENVEGIYLINVRKHPENFNLGETPKDQFKLSDPYGHDSTDEEYIKNFVQGYYQRLPSKDAYGKAVQLPPGYPPRIGYGFVEAVDYKDGKLTRYTGRIDQPWLRDKSYGEWVRQFVLDRAPIDQRTARYGVKFEDISTREERELWIAGSSLKVIDLETQEVLAERVGYMFDWAQGSRSGGRNPWAFAADNACPEFRDHVVPPRRQPAFVAQRGQTLDFVELVLKPTRKEP